MVRTSRALGKTLQRATRRGDTCVVVANRIDPAIGLTPGDRAILRDASIRLRRRHGIDPAGDRIAVDPPVGGPVRLGSLLPAVLRRYGINGGAN
jgi:hypothetical protein